MQNADWLQCTLGRDDELTLFSSVFKKLRITYSRNYSTSDQRRKSWLKLWLEIDTRYFRQTVRCMKPRDTVSDLVDMINNKLSEYRLFVISDVMKTNPLNWRKLTQPVCHGLLSLYMWYYVMCFLFFFSILMTCTMFGLWLFCVEIKSTILLKIVLLTSWEGPLALLSGFLWCAMRYSFILQPYFWTNIRLQFCRTIKVHKISSLQSRFRPEQIQNTYFNPKGVPTPMHPTALHPTAHHPSTKAMRPETRFL